MLVEMKSGKTKCYHCGRLFNLSGTGVLLMMSGEPIKPVCNKCLDYILHPGEGANDGQGDTCPQGPDDRKGK